MSRPSHRIALPHPSLDAPHVAFATVLAHSKRGSMRWKRYWAGNLVLALVDASLERRERRACSDREYLRVRRAIADVRPKATSRRLALIVSAVIAGASPRDVVVAVTQYAARLRRTGDVATAGALYQWALQTALKFGLNDLLPSTYRRLGSCFREDANFTEAIRQYDAGLLAAARTRDTRGTLLLRIAQAILHQRTGQWRRLELARVILNDVMQSAGELGALAILARAAHERGIVAHERSRLSARDADVIDALSDYDIALANYTETDRRLRRSLFNDIGRSLFRVGMRHEAKHACRYARAVTGDRMVRWAATNNLMRFAALEHDREAFDRHRAALARAPLPAHVRYEYLLEVKGGCEKFGLLEDSRLASEQAAIIRERHQLSVAADAPGDSREPDTRPVDPPAIVVALSRAVLAQR